MIRKKLFFIINAVMLTLCLSSAWAGNLYRYTDDEGVQTLSRSLPPSVAQRGYDILDDKSMRLIERIDPAPTEAEIAEMKKQAAIEAEKRRQAKIAAEKAEEARKKQAVYDRTLLTTYESEQDLIDARDKLINYRQARIRTHQAKLPELKAHLLALQEQAAKREVSGKKLTVNMQKNLDAAQQEIDLREKAIAELEAEIKELEISYAKDQQRLKQLLERRQKD